MENGKNWKIGTRKTGKMEKLEKWENLGNGKIGKWGNGELRKSGPAIQQACPYEISFHLGNLSQVWTCDTVSLSIRII